MPDGSHDPAQRFRRTRAAHADETAEDYVEAIEGLIERSGEARVKHLAELMGVSHVTVSRIVARLTKEGLVTTKPRAPIDLTPAGKRMAKLARERHETVLAFLLAAGVPKRQAEIDAEGIEHHCSKATLRAMKKTTDRLTNEP
ncbi:MAG: manganese-binding transcriptional regulator MntR [Phycisphaerales bacterium]